MNVYELRSKYDDLNPQERAEIYFAKAIPAKDDALADALKAPSLYDAYLMERAEETMLMFGGYWFSKLCLYHGWRDGLMVADNSTENILKKIGNHPFDQEALDELLYGESAAALAVALDEFDKRNGGWLRGVASLFACVKIWDQALKLGKFLAKLNGDMPFFKHLATFRVKIEEWNKFFGYKNDAIVND